jgi:hypothetical protein
LYNHRKGYRCGICGEVSEFSVSQLRVQGGFTGGAGAWFGSALAGDGWWPQLGYLAVIVAGLVILSVWWTANFNSLTVRRPSVATPLPWPAGEPPKVRLRRK